MFRFLLLFILTVAILIAVLIATDAIKEGFAATSPGTMLQLRTSHVRTKEDEEDEKKLLSLINQDLIHMTGSSLY
jgi:ABC-type lipoprotein release transport system permease subunit